MEIFDGHYYKSCKWFLEFCGLWPYQTAQRRRTTLIIFYIINSTLTIPQVILLYQVWGNDFTVTFENPVSLMFSAAVCAKYLVTFTSKKRLNSLLKQVARDWQRMTDHAEREILTKNTAKGRFLLLFYNYYIFAAWILYAFMPFLPVALDVIMPLNESRPVLMPFYANYVFFQQSDYHYWACGHMAVVHLSAFFLFSTTDTIYVITVKHTCGLFEIVCHRLNKILLSEEKHTLTDLNNSKTVIVNLSRAIQLHNESIRCCELLENSFNYVFLMVNCMGVIGLAMAFAYVVFIYAEIFKLIRIVAFVIGLLIHLLYLNWVGQLIIDSSEQVFVSAYASAWYVVSNKARRLVDIILIRSLTPCTLTSGKIAILSMENFGIVKYNMDQFKSLRLLKSAMSYFTVFLSVSQ